jgi:hypothetical protein
MEPFVSSLVGALAAGAIVAAQDTATQAIKDAYAGIKTYIADRYVQVRLKLLEEEPQSKGQQLVVREKLEAAGAENDPTLAKLSGVLVEALQSQALEAAKITGIDLAGIRAAIDIQIRRIGEEGPVRITDVEARAGSVTIEDIGYQRKN